MFRLLQGDVGSGKTIVSLISALNVIESNFQDSDNNVTRFLLMSNKMQSINKDEKNVYHKISYSYSCISRYSQFFCEPKKS